MGAPESRLSQVDIDYPVAIHGDTPLEVTTATIDRFDVETERITVVCASGDRHTADWTGIRVGDLLEAAGVSESTTHVAVESSDEYRVVVPIGDAITGILAFAKDGVPIGSDHDYENRFVAAGTEGARDIKGVSLIEPTSLEPSDNPEALENLFPDGDRFTAHRFESDEDPTTSQ